MPKSGWIGWLIASIGLSQPIHPDFGTVYNGAPNGIPFAVVSSRTQRVPVHFQYADESDRGPYPLPPNVPIEGGRRSSGDRHVIVVNRETCMDYELFAAYPHRGGAYWTAGSGAIFNLRSNHLRPAGWTSAVVIQLFLGGALLTSLGLVGLYVGRIFEQTKGRPLYVIDRDGHRQSGAATHCRTTRFRRNRLRSPSGVVSDPIRLVTNPTERPVAGSAQPPEPPYP